ncbi:Tfp pilus assembly protein FimT [Limihaloglobus sulfuriphilus]|uniref:Tfp pilus assembly protein FimT n=1 Tax=Limihaloglobus sulfuriphilus TaxID=1851148 RepID=A0A1Q2MBR0_9BACT|nr:prepilin-type N-terminal cleavage/methylation domain-containing protein [Limihaloglobus sulfuriphilus]AQQ70121.1 Tfp pilus assembly protein FimT [Limihaloglobus sulfuriphilus]
MKNKTKQLNHEEHAGKSGFTLVENLVALSIIVIVGSLGLFSIHSFLDSYESGGQTQFQIAAALSNARAIAAREGRCAGVRFQREYDPQGFGKADQYMIFIIKSDLNNASSYDMDSFHAVDGKKPIKLSGSVMVMSTETGSYGGPVSSDSSIDTEEELRDALTFSVVFSPSGRLIKPQVLVRNRDNAANPDNEGGSSISYDAVFNSFRNVTSQDKFYQAGQFFQDNANSGAVDPIDGLEQEAAVDALMLFSREDFENVDPGYRWSDFLVFVKPFNINTYSGELIDPES